MASGPSLWPFDQEILEKELTLAAVQGTAAAYARYLAVNGRAWGASTRTTSYFAAQFGQSKDAE